MSEDFQVFLVLQLHRRVLQWDELAQAEFVVLQDTLRVHGLLAILSNPFCAIESVERDVSDDIERLDFWLKIRGDYMFLSLEVREPNVFVMHDTK